MGAFGTHHATDVSAEQKPLVLVVAHSQEDRLILRLALAQVDCDVIDTTTSRSALQLILRQDIDLLVTSLDASSGTGFDLLAALRFLPVECQRPEVVVWHAYAGTEGTIPADVAIALPRRSGKARLAAAVQAVLDDPLQFVIRSRGAAA